MLLNQRPSRVAVLSAAVLVLLLARLAAAQPSDAEVIKQLTSPGVIKVELSEKPGRKEWSSGEKQYLWIKDAVVTRKANIAELPDATIEVGGYAAYSIVGETYAWRKFYVTYNTYHGIPAPPPEALLRMLSTDVPKLVGDYGYRTQIVSPVSDVALASPPEWEWHNAKSVSVNVTATYDARPADIRATQIDRVRQGYRARFYRDDAKGDFVRFMSEKRGEPEVLSSRKMSAEEVRALPSLAVLDASAKATAAAGALPKLDLPEFKSDLDLFAHTHKMLREGEEPRLKAFFLATLADGFFVPGRRPLLTPQGEQLVEEIIQKARHKKMTYAQQYGPDPVVEHYQSGLIEFYTELEPIHKLKARFAAAPEGGKMVDGKRSGQVWRLTAVEFFVSERPEHIEYLESFSSPEKLYAHHAGRTTFATLTGRSGADKPTAAASPTPTPAPAAIATAAPVEPEPEPAPAAEWKNHTWEKAKFAVDLPGAGAAEPKQTEGTAGGKFPEYILECEHGGGLIRVSAIVYGTEYARSQAAQVVEGMARSFIASNQARQRSGSDWPVGVYGRQYRLSKQGVDLSYRAAFAGKTLYQVLISAPQGRLDAATEKRLFDSFKPLP